ncbi:MAG: thermonuclease family protein [Alphaproteobacteria bacterium]
MVAHKCGCSLKRLESAALRWGLVALATALVAAAGEGVPRGGEMVAGPVVAHVLRVIDGDTIVVRARIWLGQDVETRVRLTGVDAPELRGACARERTLARSARTFVSTRIADAPVSLSDIRYDKFGGRVLARVTSATGDDLGALLVAAGLARFYAGGARAGWCEGGTNAP